MDADRASRAAVTLEHTLDLRYVGQSFEIGISDGQTSGAEDVEERFHAAHEALYGYRLERPLELVCLRTRAELRTERTRPHPPRAKRLAASAVRGTRRTWFGRSVEAARIDRAALPPGTRFTGPAIVEEYSGTTLVPPGWSARVCAGGHLLLVRGE